MPQIQFFALLLFFCAYGSAQPLSDDQLRAIDSLVLADIPPGAPGAAVGIVRDGQIIYTKYAGLADLESGRAIDEQTRFNVASNAKQFTALVILRLAQDGRLSLQDDIRKYLPSLYPDIDAPITVAHLLNHSSGIRDVYDLWSLQGITWWKQTLDNDAAFNLLRDQRELNFAPGSRHLYSNSNYILLTFIAAKAAGKPFLSLSRELFSDLSMPGAVFLADHTKSVPKLARPYFNFDTWQTYEWLSDLYGDGALFSTLPDQLAWETAVQRGQAKGLASTIIATSQESVTTGIAYGYGLEHGEYLGLTASWHNGGTGAWKASTLRFPDYQLAIVALNNSGKFFTNDLVRSIAKVLLNDRAARLQTYWPDYDYAELEGGFSSPELGVDFRLRYTGKGSYVTDYYGDRLTLKMIEPDRFTAGGYQIHLLRNPSGEITDLLLSGDRIQDVRFSRTGR